MNQSKSNISQWLTAINPFSRTNTDPNELKKNLAGYIAPVQLQRIRQDVLTWRDVINENENVWFPHRVKAQRLYNDTINNLHVSACIDRRKNLTLLRKWKFIDGNGKVNKQVSDYFLDTTNGQDQNREWFIYFLNYALDAIYFGYSLISLGSIVNNAFPDIQIIKRWDVSPDRLNVTNFTYSISGAQFMEEPYVDWHVYIRTYNDIGTSKSGYGLLYKVALYEIFLRHLMGFNGDFVELYSQPYRVGKTTKTEDKERADFAETLQKMGSSGWAMIDPEDEINFIESKLGGTGYKGYSDFEERLKKDISKGILGHADAIDSVPGKLGNGKVESPADKAMDDKATQDGSFISGVINNILIPKMRALGFVIPDDVRAILKNDAEVTEANNAVIDQAVKMFSAGLPMDSLYFTQTTGIPVTVPVVPEPPKQELEPSIKNKLDKIYNHIHE